RPSSWTWPVTPACEVAERRKRATVLYQVRGGSWPAGTRRLAHLDGTATSLRAADSHTGEKPRPDLASARWMWRSTYHGLPGDGYRAHALLQAGLYRRAISAAMRGRAANISAADFRADLGIGALVRRRLGPDRSWC